MNKTQTRLFSAFWFVVLGLLTSTSMSYLHLIKTDLVIVFILPALASAMSGFFLGAAILNPQQIKSYWQAGLRTILVVFIAFIIFAPLLAGYNALSQNPTLLLPPYLLAASAVILIATIISAGPVSLIVTLVGSMLLFYLSHQVKKRATSRN